MDKKFLKDKSTLLKIGLVALAAIAALVLFVFFTTAMAEGNQGNKNEMGKVSTEAKEVEGEIAWMNKNSIAVTYKSDAEAHSEEEILLPLNDNIKIEHKKDLSEIKIGDRVRVRFVEETTDRGDTQVLKCMIKTITFIKSGETQAQ